jgi:hypothetical protein
MQRVESFAELLGTTEITLGLVNMKVLTQFTVPQLCSLTFALLYTIINSISREWPNLYFPQLAEAEHSAIKKNLLTISDFIQIVNEMTPWSIRTKSNGMVCFAQICLVFGMPSNWSQLSLSMGKLAFFTVFASAVFWERSAQFRLVTASVDLWLSGWCRGWAAGRGCGTGWWVAVGITVDFVSQPFQFGDFFVWNEKRHQFVFQDTVLLY